MNQFKNTLIACFSIFVIIDIFLLIGGAQDKYPMLGLWGLVLSVVYFLIGIVVCIPIRTRQVGKAMLLSAGIILLIGLSVCTLNPANLNMH